MVDVSLAEARAASVCHVRADFFWIHLELVHEAVIFEDPEHLEHDGNEPRLVILELLELLHDLLTVVVLDPLHSIYFYDLYEYQLPEFFVWLKLFLC